LRAIFFVSGEKANAIDVCRQTIGIFTHDFDRLIAIGLVDFDSIGGRDSMTLEKNHHFLD